MFKLFKTASASKAPARRPEPVARIRPPSNWETVREPPTPADLELSVPAKSWLAALPASVAPRVLAERFPRIANRFALVWPDAELTDRYFDSLIIDRRGGRKGFPPDVMDELIRLRAHHGQGRPASRGTPAVEPLGFS